MQQRFNRFRPTIARGVHSTRICIATLAFGTLSLCGCAIEKTQSPGPVADIHLASLAATEQQSQQLPDPSTWPFTGGDGEFHAISRARYDPRDEAKIEKAVRESKQLATGQTDRD
jgi:hypothetical protein